MYIFFGDMFKDYDNKFVTKNSRNSSDLILIILTWNSFLKTSSRKRKSYMH